MRVLVLGGTVFVGRHVVHAALEAGHDVTMVTRGLTQPELFPQANRVHTNRDGGLAVLADRRWDAIVDTCGFAPRVVAQSVALDWTRYVFISSVSAYADLSHPNDEAAPTQADPPDEDVATHYGALKAACERTLIGRPGAVIVRPGLIAGPHDPTGRFTYWPTRIAAGGDVMAPRPIDAPVQVIDVRDLAAWLVHMAAEGPDGIFNAVGDVHSMGTALRTIQRAVGTTARLVWTQPPDDVKPWSELPLWVGPDPTLAAMMATPNTKAKAAGLTLRPLAETARDTLAWAQTLTGDPPRQVDGRYRARTLSRAREAEILATPRPALHAFFNSASSADALEELVRAGPVLEPGWMTLECSVGLPHPTLVRAAWASLGWDETRGRAELRRYITDEIWDLSDPFATLEAAWGRSVRVPVPPRASRQSYVPPDGLDPVPCAFTRALMAVERRIQRLDRMAQLGVLPLVQVNEAALAFDDMEALLTVRVAEAAWTDPCGDPPKLVPAAPRQSVAAAMGRARFVGPPVRQLVFWGEEHLVCARALGTEVITLATGARVVHRHGPARLLGVHGDVAVFDEVGVDAGPARATYVRVTVPAPSRTRGFAALDLRTGEWRDTLPFTAWARARFPRDDDPSLEDVAGGRSFRLLLDGERARLGGYAPGLSHVLVLTEVGGPVIDGLSGLPVFDLASVRRPAERRVEAGPTSRLGPFPQTSAAAIACAPDGEWRVLLPDGGFATVNGAWRSVEWGLKGAVSAAAFSPSADRLAVASRRVLRILDVHGALLTELRV